MSNSKSKNIKNKKSNTYEQDTCLILKYSDTTHSPLKANIKKHLYNNYYHVLPDFIKHYSINEFDTPDKLKKAEILTESYLNQGVTETKFFKFIRGLRFMNKYDDDELHLKDKKSAKKFMNDVFQTYSISSKKDLNTKQDTDSSTKLKSELKSESYTEPKPTKSKETQSIKPKQETQIKTKPLNLKQNSKEPKKQNISKQDQYQDNIKPEKSKLNEMYNKVNKYFKDIVSESKKLKYDEIDVDDYSDILSNHIVYDFKKFNSDLKPNVNYKSVVREFKKHKNDLKKLFGSNSYKKMNKDKLDHAFFGLLKADYAIKNGTSCKMLISLTFKKYNMFDKVIELFLKSPSDGDIVNALNNIHKSKNPKLKDEVLEKYALNFVTFDNNYMSFSRRMFVGHALDFKKQHPIYFHIKSKSKKYLESLRIDKNEDW
jgi:hypothetical protein